MSFDFDLSDSLKAVLVKLSKKDKERAFIINKKIKEVIANDEKSIERYKHLKYGLKEYKRVHIDKSFILIFMVDREKNYILFDRIAHHDDIYKE